METRLSMNKKVINHTVLFVFSFNVIGWVAYFIDSMYIKGLGITIWLISPFFVSLILRFINNDWRDIGLKLNLTGNFRWYVFSIVIFPLIVIVVISIGVLFGGISISHFSVDLYITSLLAATIGTFIKNIFEEFAWRGYLTPKVASMGIKRIKGHILVGFIWGIWHIPYYLGLLDRQTLTDYTSLSLALFIPLVIIGITTAGILFGELRLITDSVWPCILMHTTSNLIIMSLFVDDQIIISNRTAIVFSPNWEGLISMILIAISGIWLFRIRRSIIG